MTRRVYAVFLGSQWAVTYNKRQALRLASQHPGSVVRWMAWGAYHDPGCRYGWDAPTFRICSEAL